MFVEILGKQVEIISSKRNKRLCMRIVPPDAQIKVSCPPRTPIKAVEKFVKENAIWIEKATAKVKVPTDSKSYLDGGNKFILFGLSYDIVEVESNRYSLILGNENCILSSPKGVSREAKCNYLKAIMKDIIKKEIPPRIKKYEEIIGVKCSGISYRFTKSRWGSCNHNTKRINFSVYAIQKPIEYLEYLVCHELLHIIYPNHGKEFHAHLQSILPNAEELRRLK